MLACWVGAVPVAAAEPFSNPFGIQLRPKPDAMAAVRAPVVVRPAPTNEMCLVRRSDGTLELYGIAKPASDAVEVRRSLDGGLTWPEPEVAFALPGKAYYAVQVLEAADGGLHAVVHLYGEGPGGYRGRLYEVYHASRVRAAARWSEPRRIVPGYVGSIRGFTQLRTGRLVLAVARAIPEREKPPASGPDHGWNDTFVYHSDDAGQTWRLSPDTLSLALAGPNATRYGAIEPVLLELRDRVWMLVRDRGGRLWESSSSDGHRWAPLSRTEFISSDSPAGLLRLRDGRIVLFTNACQNWSDPRSYAMGGREVLHAAISGDEGRTWRGFREVWQETVAVARGDRGTAYPSAVETDSGRVVVVSGQGEGKRALFLFDPAWLEETAVQDDLSHGLVAWTQYGAEGIRVGSGREGGRRLELPASSAGRQGASWNFPAATDGEVRLRLEASEGVSGLQLCLNDHFTRVDDERAAEHAVATVAWNDLGPKTGTGPHAIVLDWTALDRAGKIRIAVDGRTVAEVSARRPARHGVNYLRVEFRAEAKGAGVSLASVEMRRK
ncbi:MAG: exo-alpha-sialidase [Verrucomicrobia bacterium]|nr:exo-alpha-sialidase [Verrucomicrobiota bacterium]